MCNNQKLVFGETLYVLLPPPPPGWFGRPAMPGLNLGGGVLSLRASLERLRTTLE